MTALPDPDTQQQFYDGVPLKRLLAWGIDMIVIVLMSLIIVPFTFFTALFFFPVLMLMVSFVYRVITLTTRSATWGMRLMAIECRDSRDRRFDFGHALLHTAGYSLSIGTALVQLVSMVLMVSTERGQGLTDLVLGTAVVNNRRQG